ncbi:probable chitinase 10 isoform X2 [Ceratina calcarata]|uniref:Probable chitinase 10 isoform X2 n=1 Tax=Ceratina calcarata TaxID=156304 RepID=A0AAJ7RZV7_9HYME|nr:probable chitinase 10 isoform X2 [Ceratina calcarata]
MIQLMQILCIPQFNIKYLYIKIRRFINPFNPFPAMIPWLLLALAASAAAGPPNRIITITDTILPPLLDPDQREADVEIIDVPAFQRGAVEGPPNDNSFDASFVTHAEYGSERFPLRDAVEALPYYQLDPLITNQPLREPISGRVPLRDAVEHREAPFFSNSVEHESIWIEPLAPPTLTRTQQIVDPKVVCYLDSSSVHRAEPFSLFPQSVPDHRCSHLIYSAATLDPDELVVVSKDREYDEIKGGYKAVTGHRARDPALQVLVSISAPNRGKLFSELTKNQCAAHCERFAESLLNFLEAHDLDGVEINWETSSERSNDLKLLLKTIRKAFGEREYILAVAQRPDDPVDQEITSIADLVILRAWRDSPAFRREKLALHPAPFKYVVRVTNKWLERVPREHRSKIILGIPVFGQGYTLKFGNFTGAGSPIVDPAIDHNYDEQKNGRMSYYQICEKLEDGLWASRRDEEGPYIKRGDQWVGYEDPLSVKIKTAYVRSIGLGGVSLWSIDLDDFQGICGNPWPMLNAATESIGFYDEAQLEKCSTDGLSKDPENCSGFYSCHNEKRYRGQCGVGKFFDPVKNRCVKASRDVCKPGQFQQIQEHSHFGEIRETQEQQHLQFSNEKGVRVVCYITSWSVYRKGDGLFVPERLDSRLCTDIIYAFAGLNPDTLLIQPFDPWVDIEHNLYERITMKGSRVLLAIGGWTDSTGDKYSRLVSSGAARRKFVASAINFLKKHNFDGLSFEWNYPKCWQSDCRKGPDSDKPNFTKLIQELRKEFDQQQPKLTLAVTMSGYKEVIDRAYEVRDISQLADFVTVMTYDYHGAWESKTGHLSPLFGNTADSNPYYNVNSTMEYLVNLGAEKSKLLVGIPMYGQAYRLSTEDLSNIGDPATGPGTPGEFTRQPGMLAYYEICDRIQNKGWKIGSGPSAYQKDQWVGYDDRESVYAKGQYILQNGFGGATLWTVDLDDFTNRCCLESFPLLKSINRALGRLRSKPSEGCQRPPEPVTPQPPTLTTHRDAIDETLRPTTPMSTTKTTTWPSWTEKPSTTTQRTTRTTWPTWTWKPSDKPASTTQSISSSSTVSSTTKPPVVQSTTEAIEVSENPADSSKPGTSCMTGEYTSDPDNCNNYFRCVLGELQREQCALGLHWDARRNICDWPAAAKCQVGTTVSVTEKPSSTTEKSTTTTTTTARPTTVSTTTKATTQKPITTESPDEETEKNCVHGQYYSYPNSCTSFRICVNGNLVSQQCGPGLNWNKEKNMCDWAFKNPCIEKPKKTASLVAAGAKSTPCTPESYSSVPGDCESFKACLWGRYEVFRCAPGLHFNERTRICDWPSRANCQDNSVPTDNQESSTPGNELPSVPTISTEKAWEASTTEPTTSLPSAVIDPEKVSPLSGHYKIVCYFTNWAWYRRGVGRYVPENIDHTLCTHIVYGFAVLDYSDLIIKAHDSWADYDNHFYERVVAYKKRGLKVSLALGGWNDSAGDKYSRLVNNPAARKKFIQQAIQFLEKYDFDGLDLDWEYPVCWQVDCKKGPASDKQGFADLLRELSSELKPRGLLLSSAVSPSKQVIDHGYDVPALAKYLDWIAVMTYDFHGQWDKKTGHVAPLYYHPDDDYYYFNANYSINYWIAKGAPRRNIVMGMPLYGQSFSINDQSAGTGLNVPASAGQAGEFTRAAGFLSYYEICSRIRNRGWNVVQDPERRMGPYAYKGNQWVSFDDADMIRKKAEYIREMGLGGGMVWALDLDDFRGKCGEGQHPLMHTLQEVLAPPPNKEEEPEKPAITENDLDQGPMPPSVASSTARTPIPTSTSRDQAQPEDKFKVICYFTNWAWYRQNGGKFLPEDVDTDLCTHVLYGFAVLDGSQLTIKSHDPWADIDNKFYERVAALKKKGVKVLMAIGGWNDSAGDKYSRLVNSPSARKRFIENVIQFIEKYEFEGLDLDWEYPVCWQVDCNKGPESDKEGFASLARELSEEFKPRGLLLSAAVSPSKRVIDAGYDVPALAKYLDWISVMTYDYHGQWDKKTGHVAPLYSLPNDWEPTFNANFSIHYWMEKGAPADKLVMGAPLYGQSFTLAERSHRGLNAPTYGGGEAGEATRARGFLSYYEICERTLKGGWTVVQDKQRRIGPYAYKGDQWVSFDDARQIKLKAELIKDLGLAGGMIWALDLDDFKNRCNCEPSPLLRTMNRVLRDYPKGPLCPVTNEFTTIDAGESSTESTTTERPSWEPVTSPRPTYLPPVSTTVDPDTDDTIEIEAGPPIVDGSPQDCGNRLFVPHKKDCSKYFLCNFGMLTEHSCPPGLYWNENRCDWPENTKCRAAQRQSNELLPLISNPETDNKKVICYLTKWAQRRPGAGQFQPEDIITDLCTHVVYGFATLDPLRWTIQNLQGVRQKRSLDALMDIKRRTGLKVLLALGGWEESKDEKYSRLAHDPVERRRFASHASRYLQNHGFDGLDLVWEYPVCWQMDCNLGPSTDKEAYTALLEELSAAFKPKGLLLSAAVSASKQVIDVAYDIPALSRYLDWLGVMSYDYHTYLDGKTGHVAPLYRQPGEQDEYLNANFSITYWLEQGVPSNKLIMGVPTYGQSFTLRGKPEESLGADVSGPGHPGNFTRSAGMLAFYEICDNVINKGWSAIKDPENLRANKGDQWVSYEDVSSIKRKAEFVRHLNLAGAMVWSLDLDDFNQQCGCGKYPLTTALGQGIRGVQDLRKDCT